MKDRGVKVIHVNGVLDDVLAEVVGFAVGNAPFVPPPAVAEILNEHCCRLVGVEAPGGKILRYVAMLPPPAMENLHHPRVLLHETAGQIRVPSMPGFLSMNPWVTYGLVRVHNANAFTVWMAGGGIKGGT